ncbi:calcium-binding protein E63-1 isoform X4 [Phlebotomus argentipes]|uniref:calcium-binding protein E63-1 isoform X4 n=1 Tax=Phlebotomus argentipes TaxID=94469 RepID=UPI0028931661|nr:calcium-binding protein E63-1 isoform X4 [Phlebotomus argentipes]
MLQEQHWRVRNAICTENYIIRTSTILTFSTPTLNHVRSIMRKSLINLPRASPSSGGLPCCTACAVKGNGLIDEAEFLQWIARIQAIKDESASSSSSASSNQPVSEEDDITQDLIAAFRVFDRDGNGFITRDELQTAMDMIGETVTEAQLTEMLALADLDKDGRINYEEFIRLLL